MAMSRPSMSTPGVGHGGEKSLDYFDDKIPPGWSPGIPGYRFVDYLAKLEVWQTRYRLAGHDTNQEGLAVMSRLHGAPWKLAVKIKLPKTVRDGGPLIDGVDGKPPVILPGTEFWNGSEAVCQPMISREVHPTTGALTQPAIPAGSKFLIDTHAACL